MPTAHMSTDWCEALSAANFQIFVNFSDPRFQTINPHYSMPWIRIWCQNCALESFPSAATHLHKFQLHAKLTSAEIRKSGIPRNSSSICHHFLNIFPQISARRHWETNLWIFRNFDFLPFRCACNANIGVKFRLKTWISDTFPYSPRPVLLNPPSQYWNTQWVLFLAPNLPIQESYSKAFFGSWLCMRTEITKSEFLKIHKLVSKCLLAEI